MEPLRGPGGSVLAAIASAGEPLRGPGGSVLAATASAGEPLRGMGGSVLAADAGTGDPPRGGAMPAPPLVERLLCPTPPPGDRAAELL